MNVKNVINNIRLDKGFSFTLQNKTHEVRLINFLNFYLSDAGENLTL